MAAVHTIVVTQQLMVIVGVDFWGQMGENFDVLTNQQINAPEGVPAVGIGAWRMGSASLMGLRALLTTPNILPWGDNTFLIRRCQTHFDTLPATVNNVHGNWLYQKHSVIRYYFQVMNHRADPAVLGNLVLSNNGKNKIKEHFQTVKNQIAALLIAKCCLGWDQMASHFPKNLYSMQQYPNMRCKYYMFVLPIVYFLCTEMNPHTHLNPRVILQANLNRTEEYMRKRLREHGIWSQDLMLEWMVENKVDENLHSDVTKGVEYQFARLCSCIVREYKWPYDETLKKPIKLYIRQTELGHVYEGYGPHTPARYGRPSREPRVN